MYPSDKESRPTRHVEVVGAETDEERRNRLMFWLTICGLCLIAGMGLDACVATYFRADSTYRPTERQCPVIYTNEETPDVVVND
jgi:hypothetical protein